jgi:type II secretory ATPase GspE/PulE/Tfp pilus assembly ATPase PilB-like protein
VKMVALAIANRLVTQGGKIQEQIGQASARYAVSSTDLTVGERAILRKYKQAQ